MAKFKVDEKKAKQDMQTLSISYDEAVQMQMDDWELEHDKSKRFDWDLTPEEEKKAIKYANAGEKSTSSKEKGEKTKKSAPKRKENPTKRGIISAIHTFLDENEQFSFENVQISNPERMISFEFGDEKYEITLIQKRKPKDGGQCPH